MEGASIFGFTHSRHLNFSSKQWKINQATNNPKQCPFHSICLTSSPSRKSLWINEVDRVSKIGGGVLQTSANWFKYVPPRNICIDDQYLYDILRGNWSFSQPEHWPHPSLSELVKPLSQQKRIKSGMRMFALIKLISSMQKSTSRWLWLGAVKHHSPVEKQI